MKRIGLFLCLVAVVLGLCLIFLPTPARAQRVLSGEEGGEEPLRILFLGKDRSAGLCDSIFLLAVDPVTPRASVLQIPRDTYAAYTARDYRKLNGALNALGDGGMREFLSRALGISIDASVTLDLAALRDIVDAVGGVDVEIEQPLSYSDPDGDLEIRLPAGQVHLDGARAEQFVRFRSGYANADLGRLDAQKKFLRALARAWGELPPLRRAGILLSLSGRIGTDLSLPEIARLSGLFSEELVEDCRMETLPGEAVQGSSGAWYYSLNREGALRAIARTMFVDEDVLRERFDPDGVFDRSENPAFHKIYTAPIE